MLGQERPWSSHATPRLLYSTGGGKCPHLRAKSVWRSYVLGLRWSKPHESSKRYVLVYFCWPCPHLWRPHKWRALLLGLKPLKTIRTTNRPFSGSLSWLCFHMRTHRRPYAKLLWGQSIQPSQPTNFTVPLGRKWILSCLWCNSGKHTRLLGRGP